MHGVTTKIRFHSVLLLLKEKQISATWKILLWLLRDVIHDTDRYTEWDMTGKNMRKIFIYCFHLLQANNFLEQVGGESPEESY